MPTRIPPSDPSTVSSPSRLIKFPGSSPQFKRGSLRSYQGDDDDLSLIDDLVQNKDRYKAQPGDTSTIALLSFSQILRLNLDRIQARVSYKPSRNSMVAACIRRGVTFLRTDERVTGLVEARTRYKLIDSEVDPEINSIIGSLLNTFTLQCPGGGRCNVNVPREYWGMVSDLSGDIGMSVGSLTTLTIMKELADQEETIKGDADELYRYVRSFFKSVSVRVRACNSLLGEYGL